MEFDKMVIELKNFRIFNGKDVIYEVDKADKEFHDSYSGFFSKDDLNETIIDSLLLHKGNEQLLEIIYKS
jgi:hypothetical protein